MLGVLIIAVLRNGLFMAGVPTTWQLIVIGVVLIAAVFVNEFFREDGGMRRARRRARARRRSARRVAGCHVGAGRADLQRQGRQDEDLHDAQARRHPLLQRHRARRPGRGARADVELDYNGPTDAAAVRQVEFIQQWVQLRCDAITVAGNDPDALAPALKEARRSGIKTGSWDADVAKDARSYFVNQATFKAIGETMTDIMAAETNKKGKFLIVTGSLTAPNTNEWIAAMKKRVKERYPKMKIASVQPGEENLQKGIDVTKSYLSANPDTAGVFGITTVALPGVAEAVRQMGLKGKVHVTGLTDPVIAKPYVDEGVIKKAVLWNPEDLGYLAVYVAKKMLDGSMPTVGHLQGRPARRREDAREGRGAARPAARLLQEGRRQVRLLTRVGSVLARWSTPSSSSSSCWSSVAALTALARILDVPYPIMLVLGGSLVGFAPGVPDVELDPELVLFIFLPPLLFNAAYFSSLRDLRSNLRPITLSAIALVLLTTVAVAVAAHAAIDGLPWAAAFALGAIVSPTDPLAATIIARRLGVRGVTSVIEGESLVNDGTALVAYRAAVVAVGGGFDLLDATGDFVVNVAGGIAFGVVAGLLLVQVFKWIVADDVVGVVLSLAAGYIGYLPAEELGVSGVLAAVAVGLIVGRRSPELSTAASRLRATRSGRCSCSCSTRRCRARGAAAAGDPADQVLLCRARRARSAREPGRIGSPLAWVFTVPYLIRAINRRASQLARRTTWRTRMVVGWSGLRGAVSLAAALALPASFPERGLLIFLTLCVIFATLIGQGLTLPP